MTDLMPSTTEQDPETSRALQLDALSGILAIERRDRMAQMLTDDDVATLRHLAKEGMGDNTLRALASDLAYLEAWCRAVTGAALPWPAPEELVLKFIAHHLWDPAEREQNAAHGMPAAVDAALRASGLLKSAGPHAPSTVQRRLAHWSTLHRWKGHIGPFAAPGLRSAMRLAVRASDRPKQRKSQRAITLDVLEQLIATCQQGRLVDMRDHALLLVAFASGGRRRSEIARLRVEHLRPEPSVPADPGDPASQMLPCLSIALGRTKTTSAADNSIALLIGAPVDILRAWLVRARIEKGAVFRAIDRWGTLDDQPLTPQAVNGIVKQRCTLAGLDAAAFSAHGLRSGYLTEAARQGVSLPDAMQQSQHRSLQQAAGYYNDANRRLGKAARLGI